LGPTTTLDRWSTSYISKLIGSAHNLTSNPGFTHCAPNATSTGPNAEGQQHGRNIGTSAAQLGGPILVTSQADTSKGFLRLKGVGCEMLNSFGGTLAETLNH